MIEVITDEQLRGVLQSEVSAIGICEWARRHKKNVGSVYRMLHPTNPNYHVHRNIAADLGYERPPDHNKWSKMNEVDAGPNIVAEV